MFCLYPFKMLCINISCHYGSPWATVGMPLSCILKGAAIKAAVPCLWETVWVDRIIFSKTVGKGEAHLPLINHHSSKWDTTEILITKKVIGPEGVLSISAMELFLFIIWEVIINFCHVDAVLVIYFGIMLVYIMVPLWDILSSF